MSPRVHASVSVLLLALLALIVGPGVLRGQGAQEGVPAETPAAGPVLAAPVQLKQIPDTELFDQDGKPVKFYTDLVQGKLVVINFIFTTCTTICPPLGANFGKLEKLLGDRAGRDVHLISISVDPLGDTPDRLKDWAAKFGRTPGWTLVTGKKPEVDGLLRALGAYNGNKLDHAPIALVGRDGGEWLRVYGLAAPDKILAQIQQLATPTAGDSP